MFIGVGVSCLFSHSAVGNLYLTFSGLFTSVWEERDNFPAIDYLELCGFCSEGFHLPLGAWDWLH